MMRQFPHDTTGKRHGQSLTEFALVLPVLLLFIMGTIDFGRALFTYAQASSQLRQALRLAAVIGYDSAPIEPYRDCDRIRATSQRVFFAESITSDIAYLRVESLPSAWDSGSNAFNEPIYDPPTATQPDGVVLCTGSTGPDDLENGDIMRVRETIQIRMITPLFPALLTFTLQGQRSIVTSITLSSVEYCGDMVCQVPGEDAISCAADCATGGNNAPDIRLLDPVCGITIDSPYIVRIGAVDIDPGDEPNLLQVSLFVDGTPIAATYQPAEPKEGIYFIYTVEWTPLPPGPYTIYASVTDNNTPVHTSTHPPLASPCNVLVSSNHAPVIDSISPAIVQASTTTQITVAAHDDEDDPVPPVNGNLTAAVSVDGTPLTPVTWDAVNSVYVVDWTAPASGSPVISVTVTDSNGATDSDSLNVTVQSGVPTTPPTIAIVSPAVSPPYIVEEASLTIMVTDDGSHPFTAPAKVEYKIVRDGIVPDSVAWIDLPFVSGTTYSTNWNTTVADNGDHTIFYHVVDADLLEDAETVRVTVRNTMHISDITINGIWSGGNAPWTADVIITVVDSNGAPVAGATVTGNWETYTGGTTGRNSCDTGADGKCTITVSGIHKNKSFRFTMNPLSPWGAGTVTVGTLSYVVADNVMNSAEKTAPPW